MAGKLRIGGVSYGVGAPLLEGLDSDPEVDFSLDSPAALITPLREGLLDAALLSSIEAFRNPGYSVLSGLGIACRGPARSVRAFARPGPIETVGLDHGSATSVALLKILLHHGLLGEVVENPTFEAIEPTLELDRLPHDLVMFIGDCGLQAESDSRTPLDLGELWHSWTGLPFVFAIWLIRGNAPADIIARKLFAAREAAVAAKVSDGTDGAIYYDIGEEDLVGLRRFHREAADLDLADPALELHFHDFPMSADSGANA